MDNNQNSGGQNAQKGGGKQDDSKKKVKIIIPDAAREKYPDLIPMILESTSMDDEERNYWFSVLSIMTPDQIKELRSILESEQNRKKMSSSSSKNIDSEKKKKIQQERMEKEKKERKMESAEAEDILKNYDWS